MFFAYPIVCSMRFISLTSKYTYPEIASVKEINFKYSKFRLPFNWRSMIGYIFATVFQSILFFGVLEIFLTVLVVFLGICQFLIAFATDIRDRFDDLKHRVELCRRKFPIANQLGLYKNLCEIVEFHSEAIQLSSSFQLQNSFESD